mmetsp:Transcript_39037/g.112092  ORF Transcript_39037/g.112092 Transcript_39037/m.112092 type:complete len:139 (-) Transcript_39037:121-537(-)
MGNAACCASDVKAGQSDAVAPTTDPVKALRQEEVIQKSAAPEKEGASPKEFTITLKKAAGLRLGVDVDLTDGIALVIDKVNPGLVEEWNKANPGKAVAAGYKIVSVNGTNGNAQAMTEVCKSDDVLEMVVQHGEPPAP